MVNSSKIKGKMAEKGITRQEIADKMGLSAHQVGRKIAGTTIMTLDEANELQGILEIPDSDFLTYFFTQ